MTLKTTQQINDEADGLIEASIAKESDRDSLILNIVNNNANQYLQSTDWYVIRSMELGETVPSEILSLRADARSRIS